MYHSSVRDVTQVNTDDVFQKINTLGKNIFQIFTFGGKEIDIRYNITHN